MALKEHLEQELAFVTVRDTLTGTPGTAGKNLVIISESAPSADAGKRFRDVRVPVLVTEPGAFDDMFMTGPLRDDPAARPPVRGDFGVSPDQTSMTIVNSTHFMAAGLTGTVRTTNSPERYAFGRNLAPGARCEARADESSTRCMVFRIGKGQALFNRMRSPARRVGFFAVEETFSALTAEGLRLFDAAVLWAAQGESQ